MFEAKRGSVVCHITYQLSHKKAAVPKSHSQDLRIVEFLNALVFEKCNHIMLCTMLTPSLQFYIILTLLSINNHLFLI